MSPTLYPASNLLVTCGSPAMARIVGSMSRWETISLDTCPGLILPGQRNIAGTRAFPVRVLFVAKRRHRGIRPRIHVRAVVGRVHDESVIGDAQIVQCL